MSYTRSYSSSITVTGHVNVSYPPSEHGGTVTASYSETVPIVTNIHVDTDPLDSSVINANAGIDVLTGSVVAMEAAQVASIRESSEKISDKLISGFYGLINMDLTTQKTEAATALKSRFLLLAQYAQSVQDMKERMESDMARLRRHYNSIFEDIDRDMKARIQTIDGKTFRLAETARDGVILGQELKGIPNCFVQAHESEQLQRMLGTARLKRKAASVIENVSDYITRETQFENNVDMILEDETVKKPETEYIPVIVHDVDSLGDGNRSLRFFGPHIKESDTILMSVNDYADGLPEKNWTQMPSGEMEKLDRAFCTCLAESSEQENAGEEKDRLYNEIRKLWQKSKENLKELNGLR